MSATPIRCTPRIMVAAIAALVAVVCWLTASSAAGAQLDDRADLVDHPLSFGGSLPPGTLTADYAADLVSSGQSLADVDVVNGLFAGAGTWAASETSHTLVADMVMTDQLAFDAAAHAEHARQEAERRRTQHTVTADGCPTDAPPNTLRDGSAAIGVAELCARSVAQAPTPEAAEAIKVALHNLGVPYSQPRRNSTGFFDCSSYFTRSYQMAGLPLAPPGQNAPTTHTLLPRAGFQRVRWSQPLPTDQILPGDAVFPSEGHVAMVLADNFIVHTNRTGDVSHIRRGYSAPYAARRVAVELVSR